LHIANRVLIATTLSFAAVFAAPGLRAEALSSSVIALFPKNVGEFGYVDLKQARQLSWFSFFERQALPSKFEEFDEYLKSIQIDPKTQIDEVAWAIGATTAANSKSAPALDDFLGVALGQFDEQAVQSLYKSRKLKTVESRGYTFYACGNGTSRTGLYFLFVDSNTLAFGQQKSLEALIAVHSAEEENLLTNETLFPLINQANGEGVFWGVLNPAGTRAAIRQMVPEASQFPQSDKLLKTMKAMVLTVSGASTLDANFKMVSDSPDATTVVSQLLQAGLMFRRYQANQSNPDLAQLLNSVTVTPNGASLTVSISASNEQVTSLVARNLFFAKM
jgi:hypothetical protein